MGAVGHHAPAVLGRTRLGGDLQSPIHRLDARAKFVGLLAVVVVAVSAPPTAWPVWAGCLAVLLGVAALGRLSPRLVAARVGIIVPVVLLAAPAIPLTHPDGGRAGLILLGAVAAKATIGASAAVILGATTGFPEMIAGLERMRLPALITLIAAVMWRYLALVGDDLLRMRRALLARGYRPRGLRRVAPIGALAGALFLRTHARGERVQLAMSARGFTGEMPRLARPVLHVTDAVFVTVIVALLIPLRLVV